MLRDVLYKFCVVWVCVLMCLVTPAFAVQISDPYTSEVKNTQIRDNIGSLSFKDKFNPLNNDSYPINEAKLITGFKDVNNLKQVKNIIVKSIISNELINSSVNSDNTTNIYGVYNVTKSKARYNVTGCLDELKIVYKSTCDSINNITVELRELKSNISSLNNEIKELDEKLANHIVTIDEDSHYLTELKEKRVELLESREKLIYNENKLEKLNNILENKKSQLNACKSSLNNLENTEDKKTVIEDYNNHLKTINQINSEIKGTNKQSIETNTEITPIETTENSAIITTGTSPDNPEPITNNNSTTDNEIITTNDEPPIIHLSPPNDYSTTLYTTWGTAAGLTTLGWAMSAGATIWRIYKTISIEKTLISYTTHQLTKIGDIAIPEHLTNELIENNIAKFASLNEQKPAVRALVNKGVLNYEVDAYTKMVTCLKNTDSGSKYLAQKLGQVGLEVEDTPTTVNKLIYLGIKRSDYR